MAGRKKIPTSLKVLKGTQRVDRVNPDEPMPDPNIPSPPDFLSRTALVEWGRITQELFKLGLLTDVDRAALIGYCESYAVVAEIGELLNEIEKTKGKVNKYLGKTTNGNIVQNQLIGTRNTSLKIMKDFLTEFGMSPASRARVAGKKKDEGNKKSPFSKLG
jgi:P27 family predicted phage terminase small subunit